MIMILCITYRTSGISTFQNLTIIIVKLSCSFRVFICCCTDVESCSIPATVDRWQFYVNTLLWHLLSDSFWYFIITCNRTGPLINTWCMRMEAKNSYFKKTGHTSNFKNVPLTVARRHQRLLCANLQYTTFFDRELTCGPNKHRQTPAPTEKSVTFVHVKKRTDNSTIHEKDQ